MNEALRKLVEYAKAESPVYKTIYENIDVGFVEFSDLPVITNDVVNRLVHNEDLNAYFGLESSNGILYTSSATTGKPKTTIFGHAEWKDTIIILRKELISRRLLEVGDRVANLCPAPSASFLFVHSTLSSEEHEFSELPLGCSLDFFEIYQNIKKFNICKIACVNSTLLGLALTLMKKNIVDNDIKAILCGGELMRCSQLSFLKKVFPNANIFPFMFATTETGIIGMSRIGWDHSTFEVLPESVIVEIVDDNLQPINEAGKKGRLVVTSKLRTQAPAIRLDTGDNAMWGESSVGKKFKVLGRTYPNNIEVHECSLSKTDIQYIQDKLSTSTSLIRLHLQLKNNSVELFGLFLNKNDNNKFREAVLEALEGQSLYAFFKTKVIYIIADEDYFIEMGRQKAQLISDLRV